MRNTALYILPIVLVVTIAGAVYGFGSMDYEKAMREQVRVADDAMRLGRRLSCVRIVELMTACVESDGGDICNTLRTAEAEHVEFFGSNKAEGVADRDYVYEDCLRPELKNPESKLPGAAHEQKENEPVGETLFQ